MGQPPADWILDLCDVAKVYGHGRRRVEALRGVSLQVRPGEIFGLLGPNGAGKSTLVKIMMSVVRADRAQGTILGHPVGHKPALARMGYLPEHHRFPRYLTGRQMIEFFGAMAGVDRSTRRKRSAELLDLVGMAQWGDRKLDTYSKGMLQRVGVAQALVNDPQLVILDEPTDGVDPIGRKDILAVLARLRDAGKTIFVNSHLLSELELISDRVAIMLHGKVVRQGTITELAAHRQWYELEMEPDAAASVTCLFHLADGDARQPLRGKLEDGVWIEVEHRPQGTLLKLGTADVRRVQSVLDGLRHAKCIIRRMELVQPSLEELFMEAVADGKRPPAAGPVTPPPIPEVRA